MNDLDSELITKFNNIFVMLHYSMMTNEMERVKHFLAPEMYTKCKNIVEDNLRNHEIEMFDELNVKDTRILEKKDLEDCYQITVQLTSRYMDYFIDLETGKYKRGIQDHRIEKVYILVFEKSKNHEISPMVITCPNCGANLDVHFTGICSYCGESIDLSKIDYQLVDMKIVS